MIIAALLAVAMPTAHAQAPRPGQQLAPGPGQAAPPRGRAPKQAPQPPAVKPYKTVAVTLPQPYADPSFEAFRKQLADIAARKDRAALAKLIVTKDFFWMGEKGDKANKRKSAIDNLAAAIELDAKDGSGWQTLAAIAGENTLEPIPDRKGIMCAPANPTFDESAAEQVAKDTGTDPGDWGYTAKADVEVHEAAKADSPVVERLGLHLVRVMPEEGAPGQPSPAEDFMRIVTPSGKVGYLSEADLSSLDSDQMCYVKDATGWKIAGYAGND